MDIYSAVMRRLSPMAGILPAAEVRRIQSQSRFDAGVTKLWGRAVHYSSSEGFLHSLREIFIDEVYKFAAKRPDPFIIDAGANIGLSVLYFQRLYPEARIVAFEPDSEIFALLRRNTAHLAGLRLHQAAAWCEDAELKFFSEGSLAGSLSLDFESKNKVMMVEGQRLRNLLDGDFVDFLKIDIEGAENAVLPDIADRLGNVDSLFFEYHSSPDEPQQLSELLEIVREAGFRYAINGCHCPAHPFVEKISHGFDLQLNVSCFRDWSTSELDRPGRRRGAHQAANLTI